MSFDAPDSKHVPADFVDSSLINSLRDNNVYPEQEWAIMRDKYRGPQPFHYDAPAPKVSAGGNAEVRFTDPYKK